MHLSVEPQLSLQMTWVVGYFVSQGKSLRLLNKGQQNLRYVLTKTPAAYIFKEVLPHYFAFIYFSSLKVKF